MAAGVSRRECFLPDTTCGCCNCKLLKLLFLVRRQNHYHLATFHLGHLLDQCVILKIRSNPLDLAHTDFLVCHFATAEAQRNLDFVFFLQKARHIAQLDLVIVFVSTWPELDFLDLNLLLLEFLLMLTLLFLVLEFAVVHDSANRRLRHRSNLNQINPRLFGQLQSLTDGRDSERLTFFTYQSNFRCVDLFVNALRLLQCDGSAPCADKN